MAENVPADKVPDLLKKVVTLFSSKGEPGESLHDVLERCGVSEFVEALAPYSQDAHDGDLLGGGNELELDSEEDGESPFQAIKTTV